MAKGNINSSENVLFVRGMKYILKLNELFFLVIWLHPKNIIEQIYFFVEEFQLKVIYLLKLQK